MKFILCVADHYEPFAEGVDDAVAAARVKRWVDVLPGITKSIQGSDGVGYKHSFFYPKEEYNREIMRSLEKLSKDKCGEVEIHIHHENVKSDEFRSDMEEFKSTLRDEHGLLPSPKNALSEVKYAFIHGNWALDNSRPDGRWCGVNDELICLNETGCYADFTFPSAPDITQPPKINSIYYAKDDPEKPSSHNNGVDLEVGGSPTGDLLLIQGPLGITWKRKKGLLIPSIENGEIGGGRPPTLKRFKSWSSQCISVSGKNDWIFIKLHCHGATEKNSAMLLGEEMRSFLKSLIEMSEQEGFSLNFVTAREMYNIIKAAEAGEDGDPSDYRDYELVLVDG